MKKVFVNSSRVQCFFTEDGVTFGGLEQEIFLPYGCVDSIKLSLFGVLQAVAGKRICTFAVDKADRAAVKDMVKYAQQAMLTAPKAEPVVLDLARLAQLCPEAEGQPAQEQLKLFKPFFVQGILSKDELNAIKRRLQ